MGVLIGLVIAIGCMLGGFVAMGGHLVVLWQPWEFVIIGGMGAGTFVMANPMKTVVDSGKASMDALTGKVPKRKDYLALLGLLHALMRELKTKPRNEVEPHLDDPANSEIFKAYPDVAKNADLVLFICDYARLILIGNARAHEIEALMDEEISGYRKDRLKPYGAVTTVAEAMPALGIVAAVLGIVKAMGALDQSPQILGRGSRVAADAAGPRTARRSSRRTWKRPSRCRGSRCCPASGWWRSNSSGCALRGARSSAQVSTAPSPPPP